ncbi:hypothetical protein DY000_02010519 [Brassica cretica]|uniref:Uncharacterized protein n=1 Tax=Brassica cretica TaxID=69181 RepID=A0ABQ7CCT3_BRACR|nr:hypothetical protein DY000_02010519 [Brassica cretica]
MQGLCDSVSILSETIDVLERSRRLHEEEEVGVSCNGGEGAGCYLFDSVGVVWSEQKRRGSNCSGGCGSAAAAVQGVAELAIREVAIVTVAVKRLR